MTGVGRGRALILAVLSLLIGAVSYVIGVRSGIGQRAEESVLGASAFTANPPAPLSLVSVPTLAVALLVIAVVAWRFHGIGRALWILLFGGGAIVVSQALKQQWLVRPSFADLEADNTFPSGHMTVFAVLVAGAIWAVPAAARGVLGLLGGVLLGIVSWQLIAFGWHRPSDVVGAQALGVFAFGLAAALRPARRARRIRAPGPGAAGLLTVVGVLLTVTGALLVVGGLLLVAGAGVTGSDAMLINGSEIALVGSALVTTRAFLTLAA